MIQWNDNRRILVVDDEPEIRRAYQILLASVTPGFEITEAETGETALEIIRQEHKNGRRFAGAFVDVRMPGKLDGIQLINEAWKIDSGLQVVLVTAYQDRTVDDLDRIFGSQFQDQWDYLNKPFTTGEILQKARQLVSHWNRREREGLYSKLLSEQEKLAALGRLAHSVGHEFGNILQPLITRLEITKDRLVRNETAALPPMFDEMLEAAWLGSHICQDLLTFGREERINPGATKKPVCMQGALDKTLRLLRHEIKKRDVQVNTSLPEDIVVHCSESRIVQVLIDLFSNALYAIEDGGWIEVTGEKTQERLILRIRDNGAGISEENLKRLFQPLFTTKGEQGNGLGLMVCKQILEEAGGKIAIRSVESPKTGHGTTVEMEIPLTV